MLPGMTNSDPLFSVAVMPSGEVQLIPGPDFTPDHTDQAAEAVAAVAESLTP